MKVFTTIIRILLGLAFVVFGLNIFFHFLPMKPPVAPPERAQFFMRALMGNPYMLVIGGLQVAGGALLLLGRYVALGLTLLGPVIVNIDLYHLCLDPSGLPIAAVVSALALFLLARYRAHFAGLLTP